MSVIPLQCPSIQGSVLVKSVRIVTFRILFYSSLLHFKCRALHAVQELGYQGWVYRTGRGGSGVESAAELC